MGIGYDGQRDLLTCVVSSIGLALYWSWRSFITANILPAYWIANGGSTLQEAMPSIGALAVALVIAVAYPRTPEEKIRRSLAVTCGAVAVLGSLATLALCAFNPETPLFYLVQLLALGFGMPFVVFWGEYAARLRLHETALCFAGSFALSGVMYGFLSMLPPSLPFTAVVSLAPAASAALYCWFLGRHHIPDVQIGESAGRAPDFSYAFVAVLVVFVGVEEFLRITLTQTETSSSTLVERFSFYSQLGSILGALIVCGIAAFNNRPFAFSAITRSILAILVLGFVTLLLFYGERPPVCFFVLGAGFWCLYSLVLVGTANISHYRPGSAFRCFAVAEGSLRLSSIVAQCVGFSLDTAAVTNTSVVALCILVVVGGAMLLLGPKGLQAMANSSEGGPEREDGPAETNAEPGQEIETAPARDPLLEVSETYGLSPREVEVFKLLAKGRSLPYIQDELNIAFGTAQAHTRHIYTKLGVHSRQELLDLIEEPRRAGVGTAERDS